MEYVPAVGEFIGRLRLAPDYNDAATSLIVTDWQFDKKKEELWQDNAVFCQGLNLSLAKAGHIQHPKTSNHTSHVGFTEQGAAMYQAESDDDFQSLLEQLELATSETTDESIDEVVNVESRKEMSLTSSDKNACDKFLVGRTITEARVASNESPAFATDQEDFVLVSADETSSSITSQQCENTSAGDEVGWPSWTGM